MLLARIQNQVLEKGKSKWSKAGNTYKPNNPTLKNNSKGSGQTSPLWKERQIRDYLKANGLCFYCREPFDANHLKSCTKRPQQQLNTLAINGLDAVLTDDVLYQLDLEDNLASDFCQLSLNALDGTAQEEALVIRALIQNKVMLILVDSGSSHSFISKSFVHKLSLPTVPMTPPKS